MRDLAVDVMGDMGLRDAVGGEGSNPGHEGSKLAKEFAIHGGESTTGESELSGTVMREQRVGVLKERDQYEPVVDPKTNISDNRVNMSW